MRGYRRIRTFTIGVRDYSLPEAEERWHFPRTVLDQELQPEFRRREDLAIWAVSHFGAPADERLQFCTSESSIARAKCKS